MSVRYVFTRPDGTEQPGSESLTPVQQAFLALSEMGIGIPRLDRKTLDEFVRRADLLQAYVGTVWRNGDGTPRIFTRADFTGLLPGARTNWSPVTTAKFNQLIKAERDAYWKSVDSKQS
ncbi:hypothetical protein SEA_KRADAL_299 [Streptomyces phage Kradal]|nr:hypothetical protein SEA_KRADAL_299 [Streptomyces phage Kradal]QPL14607.1 hypothetical protein SEA_EHYELIMAYOE_302 [Streptomyces phage EhyElimayoE]